MKIYNLKAINKRYLNFSIKEKLLFFIMTFTIVISGLSIYSTLHGKIALEKYDIMFQKIIWINNLVVDIDQSYNAMRQYLITGDKEFREEFFNTKQLAQNDIVKVSGVLNNEKSIVTFVNIQNMFNNYIRESTNLIYKNQTDSSFLSSYQKVNEINKYIDISLKELMDYELDYNKQFYEIIGEKATSYQSVILVALILLFISSTIFSWRFSDRISYPIQKLADQAVRISNGQLEMKDIKVETNDEIGRLTIAFNEMIHNIQNLISEIKEKAKLEALLKETELKALQSQVNPHFLFNILGGITEAALTEGADKTLSMVEEISGLLRYSLTSFYKAVTLEDEITVVKRYIFLQSQRFGDRIKFVTEIPEVLPVLYMPCMTIQPFVENAIIHGLESKIEGGTIHIIVKAKGERVIVCIRDDGMGMEPEILEKLLNNGDSEPHTGHTTGIGVNNVKQRLKIFFGIDNLLRIDSKKGIETTVSISLPCSRA